MSHVTVELPVGETPPGVHVTRHVDVQLDTFQAAALRRVMDGLDQSGARLRSGARVVNATDTVRWVLEQVAQSLVS